MVLGAQTPSALLDDFSTMRTNGIGLPACWNTASPPENANNSNCLWPGAGNNYTGCYTSNNTLVCTVSGGTAPYGISYWMATLDGNSNSNYSDPGSFVQAHIKSGTWSSAINRLRLRLTCSVGVTPPTGGAHWLEWGTYIRTTNEPNASNSGQGQHFYHETNSPIFANQWVYQELNNAPTYKLAGSSYQPIPADPQYYTPWPDTGAIYPVTYWSGMTHFYFGPTNATSLQPSGVTCTTADMEFYAMTDVADDWVKNISVTYNPGTSQYSLDWGQPVMVPGGVTYEVRYATSSMRTNGWSTGTPAGTVIGPDDSPYAQVGFTSSGTLPQELLYWGVKPHMPVQAFTNTNPAIVTLKAGNTSLLTGDQIQITGVTQSGGGSHPINGTYTVTANRPTNLNMSAGAVTSVNCNGTICTVVAANHGLTTGQIVYGNNYTANATVTATNGSATVTWVSGDYFSQAYVSDYLYFNGTAYQISSVSNPAAYGYTTATLSTPYTGTTGNYAVGLGADMGIDNQGHGFPITTIDANTFSFPYTMVENLGNGPPDDIQIWSPGTLTLNGANGTSWPALTPESGYAISTGNTTGFAEIVYQNMAVGSGAAGSVTTGSTTQFSPCDLNQDGVVNNLDVEIAISQALGTSACTNASLQNNGTCTVVDVQRVVDASLGQSCLVGP